MRRVVLRIASEPALVVRVHLPVDGGETERRLREALRG
jgi:hypothetical protein